VGFTRPFTKRSVEVRPDGSVIRSRRSTGFSRPVATVAVTGDRITTLALASNWLPWVSPVSYTHLTLPTSDLV